MRALSSHFIRFGKLGLVSALLLAIAGCNQPGTDQNANNGAEPAPASVSEPEEPVRGFLRAVHTAYGAGSVALAVGDEQLLKDLQPGSVSEFIGLQDPKVEAGAEQPHRITAVNADGKVVAGPLELEIAPGQDVSVVIGGSAGKLTLTPFEHASRGVVETIAKVAVLHADNSLPEVTVSVDGDEWTGSFGFGDVTPYREVSPTAQSMRVVYDKAAVRTAGSSGQPAVDKTTLVTLTQQLNLEAGKVYSVILHTDEADTPRLLFLEDKFVPSLADAPEPGKESDNTATGNAATGNEVQ